jgi:hypothetical protein
MMKELCTAGKNNKLGSVEFDIMKYMEHMEWKILSSQHFIGPLKL